MLRLREEVADFYGELIPDDPHGRFEVNALKIEGEYSPGLAVVRKASIPITWDKRKGYGIAGAWLIYTGLDLADFDVEFTIWTRSQQIAWAAWKNKYLNPALLAQPQNNGAFLPSMPRPKALGVSHPLLNELNITAIVPTDIGQWDEKSPGRWVKVVKFSQYKGPAPAIGKPAGAIPPVKKEITAGDAVELQNRAKRQHIEALQQGLAQGAHP